jgi:arabinogalactan endo-1,4-beta-galactosidase
MNYYMMKPKIYYFNSCRSLFSDINYLKMKTPVQICLFSFILFVSILNTSCRSHREKEKKPVFLVGADISFLDRINEYGGIYKENGKEKDALEIFKNNGYNYVRLRLYNSPNMEGSTCQDLAYTIKLAKRIKKSGMKMLLSFHYSDTWTNPGTQSKPAAWENLPFEILKDSVYQYTLKVMKIFHAEGVTPDMAGPGNEIQNGMMWPEGKLNRKTAPDDTLQWKQFTELMMAGIRGIKDSPDGEIIPIMIHSGSGGDKEDTKWYYGNIIAHEVDFDIIGISYYPWWQGTFEMLEDNIQFMSGAFKKDIIVVETAYQWKGEYEGKKTEFNIPPFPNTEQGQYDFLHELYLICRKYPQVKGIFYWYPESVKTNPESGLRYRERSLFKEDGEALLGIKAFPERN